MGRELTEEERQWFADGLDHVRREGARERAELLDAWAVTVDRFVVQVDSADWDLESFLTSFEAPADGTPKALEDHARFKHYREGLQVVVDRQSRSVVHAGIWSVFA